MSESRFLYFTLQGSFPLGGSGAQQGRFGLVEDLLEQDALLVEDGLDVLAVAHDPREGVACRPC